MRVCVQGFIWKELGKGVENYVHEKMGGGGGGGRECAIGSGGIIPHKIFEFIPSEVHFQTHLWSSTDMVR